MPKVHEGVSVKAGTMFCREVLSIFPAMFHTFIKEASSEVTLNIFTLLDYAQNYVL